MKKQILRDKMDNFKEQVAEEERRESWQKEMESRRFMSAVLEFNTEYNLAMCECYGRVDPENEQNTSSADDLDRATLDSARGATSGFAQAGAAAGGGGGEGGRGTMERVKEEEEEMDPDTRTARDAEREAEKARKEKEEREMRRQKDAELREMFASAKDEKSGGTTTTSRRAEGSQQQQEPLEDRVFEEENPDRALMSRLIQEAGDTSGRAEGLERGEICGGFFHGFV